MLLADMCRSLYCGLRLECDDDDVNSRPAKLARLLQRQGSVLVQMEGVPQGRNTISRCWDGRPRPSSVECRESSERLNLIRALGRGGAWSGSASGGL